MSANVKDAASTAKSSCAQAIAVTSLSGISRRVPGPSKKTNHTPNSKLTYLGIGAAVLFPFKVERVYQYGRCDMDMDGCVTGDNFAAGDWSKTENKLAAEKDELIALPVSQKPPGAASATYALVNKA